MKSMPTSGPALTVRKAPKFLLGLILGVFLTASGSALWADDNKERNFAKSVLYAISELAIDTEVNAERIVELQQRVDDLEIVLEKIQRPKD